MRFSVFSKFITPRKKTNNKKHAIQCSDGSITSDDDNSSISSSTNNNDSSSTSSSTLKLHRKHNFPMLSTNKSSNTTQHQLRALPIHIQFAFGMFMKRPIYDNWVYLVSLLRGEKLRQLEMSGCSSGGSSSALGRIEKSLADELTVFEAEEEVHDEEDDEQLDDEEEKDSTMKHDEVEEKQQQSNNNNIGSSTTPTSTEIDIPETVAKTFIKRPSAGNWDLLVELFRKEKRQQQNAAMSSTLLRKDQPHQVLRVESDLTFDEEHNDDDDTKTLSIIYESDEELEEEEEDGGESRNPAEEGVGEAHYEAYDSDEEVEEVLAEKGEEETNPSTTKKEEQSPFAEHELDWPWPNEEEAVLSPIVAAATAAAAPEEEEAEEEAVQTMTKAAPTTLPAERKKPSSHSSSPRIPPGFANTKAKVYVLLWEKRCRRFDQSQVNVVQKSSLVPNNDDNNNAVVTDEVVVAVNSRKKNDDVSSPLATTPTTTTTTRTTKAAEGRDDEVNQYHHQYYYEENQSSCLLSNNDVITHRTQSPAVVEEVTNSVRDEVNYWENKMRNIHKDASYVLGR